MTFDVQHEPRTLARFPCDRQSGELLQGIECRPAIADQIREVATRDAHHCTVAFDIHVDVAVEICNVEQALKVVGRDIAFALECIC